MLSEGHGSGRGHCSPDNNFLILIRRFKVLSFLTVKVYREAINPVLAGMELFCPVPGTLDHGVFLFEGISFSRTTPRPGLGPRIGVTHEVSMRTLEGGFPGVSLPRRPVLTLIAAKRIRNHRNFPRPTFRHRLTWESFVPCWDGSFQFPNRTVPFRTLAARQSSVRRAYRGRLRKHP